jgi:hypothetical protein
MCRTKDMNLLMQQEYLNQFENEFKLSTETIEYYCTIGFYLFLAFQRHKVCNFWIYGLKVMNFASFSNLKQFKNKFQFGAGLGLTRGTTLLVRTGSVGSGSVAVRFKRKRAIQRRPYPSG